MRVAILGAAESWIGDAPIDLGTRKQRALLAALALHANRPVRADVLVDLIWGNRPPTAITATLQGYVAKLRRALEPDRAPRAPSEVLVLADSGYRLVLAEDALDSARFEREVRVTHERLEGASLAGPLQVDRPEELVDSLERALSLWRGTPYAELEDAPAAQSERARLEELRAVALEDRAVASLALGRHAMVAGELEVLTSTYPLRERLWGLRAVALAGSGRQADALEVLREVRELLAEELGLEPGAELRELQGAVLRQDPTLERPAGRPVGREPRRPVAASRAQGWPLVGRDDELAALLGVLADSGAGPAFAAITGEAGIGKTRLCAELATAAAEEGIRVVVGRCSQDEGAPPLWPWAGILRELGHDLDAVAAPADRSDPASAFRTWETIVRLVLEAAASERLVVVLDDLHWADASTLRVLRLLAETAQTGRLLVVATWRHEPAPTGQLAEVAQMLARRHALRLELTGLTAEEASEVVTMVAASAPTRDEGAALRERTDGNPFFLVEYARLAGERGDLAGLLAEEHPPAAVQDVLGRRLDGLPEATLRLVRAASMVGRDFDVATVVRLVGDDEDAVLDGLDPALAAGLLREDGVDRMRFAHALVRDTVYGGVPLSRRARAHARLAEILEHAPGRQGEVTRHWLASGPQHAGRAWTSAGAAAKAALRVHGYEEAVDLLRQALAALEQDPAAGPEQEYDLLHQLARSLQLSGNWVDLREVVHRMIELSGRLDDLDRLVTAAVLPSEGALWQSAHHGTVDEVIVDALRAALDQLPPGDEERRCRVMVALSGEIYYSASPAEREALAEEALAMAARLGDPELRLHCCMSASISTWRAATAESRLALVDQALELAHTLDEGLVASSALTMRAVVLHELGRIDEMDVALAAARSQAERERHLYGRLVVAGLAITWTAVRGQREERERLLAEMLGLASQMSLAQMQDAVTGAVVSQMIWDREYDAMQVALEAAQGDSILPFTAVRATMLARAGRLSEAAELVDDDLLGPVRDDWFAPMSWAVAAELSLRLHRPVLAAQAYDLLSPLSGRPACAGSGAVIGPVDAYLAMAAAAVGDTAVATRHADRAADLCEQWRAAPVADWLRDVRAELDF